MPTGEVGTATSRAQDLIEAYASTPERESPEDRDTVEAPPSRPNADAAVLSTLDVLHAWVVAPLGPEPGAASAVKDEAAADVDTPGAQEVPAAPVSPATAAETVAVAPARAPLRSRIKAWRLPHGLLYWLTVGAAASATWRLSSSLYSTVVAALVASAAVIVFELLLRAIDPRIARRLGLAHAPYGRTIYAAGALLGLATGVAATHIL